MFVIFSVFYILIAAAMIVLILLQNGAGADAGSGFDEGMVTNVAVAPDHGPLHDVRESPDLRAGPHLVAFAKRKAMNKYACCRGHG